MIFVLLLKLMESGFVSHVSSLLQVMDSWHSILLRLEGYTVSLLVQTAADFVVVLDVGIRPTKHYFGG